jgi:N-glycosylase/DNA lyase
MIQYRNAEFLLKEYKLKKEVINKALKSFDKFSSLSEEELFEELAFCIFTPGSKALGGGRAVAELKKKNLLFKGSRQAIAKTLRGIVRFHNNKALYLTEARKCFIKGGNCNLRNHVSAAAAADAREWLASNIKGIGYKEASHFMRNIGLGADFAILDTHILKNLKFFNVIKKIPVSAGRKLYLGIERRMKEFSKRIGIPMDALDILFWSHETGFFYK